MLEIYLPVFERLLCSIYSETERSSGSEETLFETRNMHVYIRNASFLLARRIALTLFSLDLIYFEPVQVRGSQFLNISIECSDRDIIPNQTTRLLLYVGLEGGSIRWTIGFGREEG